MRRLLQRCLYITVGLVLGAGAAEAQFLNRPVRLLVPYPPGGLVDILARTLQEPLSTALGQPSIVENKPGAAGGIATRFVAQSKPDGYTLIFGNNGPSALLPLIQKDVGYDPVDDFTPVSMIATAPMVLVVHKDVPVDNLKDFIAYARQKGGTVTYSSAGIGALGHLTTELFAQMANAKLTHVPYKGSAPAVMAVLDGEVQMYLSSPSETLSAGIKAGKVKLLGVSRSERVRARAGNAGHCRGASGVRRVDLVWRAGAEGHAAPDRRAAQQGVSRRPGRSHDPQPFQFLRGGGGRQPAGGTLEADRRRGGEVARHNPECRDLYPVMPFKRGNGQ